MGGVSAGLVRICFRFCFYTVPLSWPNFASINRLKPQSTVAAVERSSSFLSTMSNTDYYGTSKDTRLEYNPDGPPGYISPQNYPQQPPQAYQQGGYPQQTYSGSYPQQGAQPQTQIVYEEEKEKGGCLPQCLAALLCCCCIGQVCC